MCFLLEYHGKLIKLAGGIFHTHHHLADGRLDVLTALAVETVFSHVTHRDVGRIGAQTHRVQLPIQTAKQRWTLSLSRCMALRT